MAWLNLYDLVIWHPYINMRHFYINHVYLEFTTVCLLFTVDMIYTSEADFSLSVGILF